MGLKILEYLYIRQLILCNEHHFGISTLLTFCVIINMRGPSGVIISLLNTELWKVPSSKYYIKNKSKLNRMDLMTFAIPVNGYFHPVKSSGFHGNTLELKD